MSKDNIENIDIEITRKNVKRINIRILLNGKVKVSAPLKTSQILIDGFISEKKPWILKNLEKIKQKKFENNCYGFIEKTSFNEGEQVYLWGIPYVSKVHYGKKRRAIFNKATRTVDINLRKNDCSNDALKVLEKYYKNIVILAARSILMKYENKTGLKCNELKSQFMKSVWGTCNHKTGVIRLNAQLALMDMKFLDYIIIHELSHIKYPNHSIDFKNFVEKYLKNWKEIRNELKT